MSRHKISRRKRVRHSGGGGGVGLVALLLLAVVFGGITGKIPGIKLGTGDRGGPAIQMPLPPINIPPIAQLPIVPPLQQSSPSTEGMQMPPVGGTVTIVDNVYGGGLEGAAQEALNYASSLFGSGAVAPITVYIQVDPKCSLHAEAHPDNRDVQVFTCGPIGTDRVIAILAHEFVHQFEYDRYGHNAHMSSDPILAEGAATLFAGDYWGRTDWRDYVRNMRANGQGFALWDNYDNYRNYPDYPDIHDRIYYQWASFVQFLIERYGPDKFDAVYMSGGIVIGGAQYRAVYGKDLGDLDKEWLEWLG